MKTTKFLVLTAIIAILAIGCQPDKAALKKAKADGTKNGFDSATLFFSLDGFDDIRTYAYRIIK